MAQALEALGWAWCIDLEDGLSGDGLPVYESPGQKRAPIEVGGSTSRVEPTPTMPTVAATDLFCLPEDMGHFYFVANHA